MRKVRNRSVVVVLASFLVFVGLNWAQQKQPKYDILYIIELQVSSTAQRV